MLAAMRRFLVHRQPIDGSSLRLRDGDSRTIATILTYQGRLSAWFRKTRHTDRSAKGCEMTVKNLLEQKGGNVWTISSDATVFDALAMMAEKDIGSLVVMDGEKLIGIVTERHYSRNVILKGKRSPTTLVKDIMDRNVIYVRPEQTVELCMALMTEKRVRHLPVLEGNKMIGIVSIGDLLKGIISKQKFVIDELEHYIHG
jgi:CBS domain-containing protein